MNAVRPLNVPPGNYFVPRPSGNEEMRSPEFKEKMKQGPVMMLTVWPNGQSSMSGSLVLWFLYLIVVATFAAYIAVRTLPVGMDFFHVFRIIGVAAFLGYSAALWQMSIWFRRDWTATIKATVDGLIYAVLTASIFGWLWP